MNEINWRKIGIEIEIRDQKERRQTRAYKNQNTEISTTENEGIAKDSVLTESTDLYSEQKFGLILCGNKNNYRCKMPLLYFPCGGRFMFTNDPSPPTQPPYPDRNGNKSALLADITNCIFPHCHSLSLWCLEHRDTVDTLREDWVSLALRF